MKLLRSQSALESLQKVIESCEQQRNIPKGRNVNRVRRTGQEMRLSAQIGDFDMNDIILDLGSEVNVLTRQTWELMGEPRLEWSPIPLKLANQQKIVPLGRCSDVPIDIDGVRTLADFEVIEIIDDSNPYLALLGIEWALDNLAVINLKKRQMIFEGNDLRVIVPLDPSQGERYTKPVREEYDDAIDTIYNITAHQEDYINPTADGI